MRVSVVALEESARKCQKLIRNPTAGTCSTALWVLFFYFVQKTPISVSMSRVRVLFSPTDQPTDSQIIRKLVLGLLFLFNNSSWIRRERRVLNMTEIPLYSFWWGPSRLGGMILRPFDNIIVDEIDPDRSAVQFRKATGLSFPNECVRSHTIITANKNPSRTWPNPEGSSDKLRTRCARGMTNRRRLKSLNQLDKSRFLEGKRMGHAYGIPVYYQPTQLSQKRVRKIWINMSSLMAFPCVRAQSWRQWRSTVCGMRNLLLFKLMASTQQKKEWGE